MDYTSKQFSSAPTVLPATRRFSKLTGSLSCRLVFSESPKSASSVVRLVAWLGRFLNSSLCWTTFPVQVCHYPTKSRLDWPKLNFPFLGCHIGLPELPWSHLKFLFSTASLNSPQIFASMLAADHFFTTGYQYHLSAVDLIQLDSFHHHWRSPSTSVPIATALNLLDTSPVSSIESLRFPSSVNVKKNSVVS